MTFERFTADALTAIRELEQPGTADIRRIRRTLSRQLREAEPHEVLAAADVFRRAGYRWVAYEIVHHHRSTMASLDRRQVESLGEGIDSWDTVDPFGIYVAGPAWMRGRITDADVLRWARQGDVWWRRTALVATTVLNTRSRGGRGDTGRTLAIAAVLTTDPEDMVVKGLSWALRALVPWDPDAVQAFVDAHHGALAARVKREVGNKLRTGLKNPRR